MYTEAMKYSPLNLKLGEGETMAMAAANRSKIILPIFVFSTEKKSSEQECSFSFIIAGMWLKCSVIARRLIKQTLVAV